MFLRPPARAFLFYRELTSSLPAPSRSLSLSRLGINALASDNTTVSTCFFPSDSAWVKFLAGVGLTRQQLLDNGPLVQKLARSMVVPHVALRTMCVVSPHVPHPCRLCLNASPFPLLSTQGLRARPEAGHPAGGDADHPAHQRRLRGGWRPLLRSHHRAGPPGRPVHSQHCRHGHRAQRRQPAQDLRRSAGPSLE